MVVPFSFPLSPIEPNEEYADPSCVDDALETLKDVMCRDRPMNVRRPCTNWHTQTFLSALLGGG